MKGFVAFALPRRLALGFSPSRTPGLFFVAVGFVLGPAVSNVLSADVVAQLDPVVSMALAIAGAFIGAGFGSTRHPGAALVGALGQATVTFAGIAVAIWFLLSRWQMPLPVDLVTAAVILGICSAASAAIHPLGSDSPQMTHAATLADLDDVPIIVVATFAVPIVGGVVPLAPTLAFTVLGAVTIALAGVLLFSRADTTAERGVVVTGTLLLLGGAAAYTNASPLTTGLIAGLLWQRSTRTAAFIGRDFERLQHPLLALLMLAAGATMQLSWPLLWLAAPLAILRISGKTLGGLLFARIARLPAGLLSTVLLPPGVLGIALALNFQQVVGGGDTLLLSAVTVSAMLNEVFARFVLSREDFA
jgi:hypothetical protein